MGVCRVGTKAGTHLSMLAGGLWGYDWSCHAIHPRVWILRWRVQNMCLMPLLLRRGRSSSVHWCVGALDGEHGSNHAPSLNESAALVSLSPVAGRVSPQGIEKWPGLWDSDHSEASVSRRTAASVNIRRHMRHASGSQAHSTRCSWDLFFGPGFSSKHMQACMHACLWVDS